MRLKFDKDPLVVEQNNYAAIVINAYIVYELDTLPKILLNNFIFKKGLFGGTNTVKKSDGAKWVYFCHGIAFVKAGSWSFGCNFVRNVIIFGVDNSF